MTLYQTFLTAVHPNQLLPLVCFLSALFWLIGVREGNARAAKRCMSFATISFVVMLIRKFVT